MKDCVKNFYRNKKRIFEKGKGEGRLRLMKKRKAEFNLEEWEEQRGLAVEST